MRAIGYPLPLFFQWDDIEFGYRARAHGYPTVALPGAGVWHADFGWKDWDEWHRYFNMRNGLITAALHTDFSVRRITYRLGQLLGQYLVAMHYGLAATLLQAVEDFLDGPEALDDGSAAAAAKIRRIRADYPETVMHPMSELRDDFRELQVVRAANAPGNERLTWAKRVAYLLADRAAHRTGFVPAGDAHWWHVSTFARAVVTDMSEQGLPGAHPGPGAGAGADPARGADVPPVPHRGAEGGPALPGGDGPAHQPGELGPAVRHRRVGPGPCTSRSSGGRDDRPEARPPAWSPTVGSASARSTD